MSPLFDEIAEKVFDLFHSTSIAGNKKKQIETNKVDLSLINGSCIL